MVNILIISIASPALTPSQTYSPARHEFSAQRHVTDGASDENYTSISEQAGSPRNVNRGSLTPRSFPLLPSDHDRGRLNRFKLASVSQALMDVVSPKLPRSRQFSRDDHGSVVRGRTRDRRYNTEPPALQATEAEGRAPRPKGLKEHHIFDRFGEILHLDDPKVHKDAGRGWKEFKKGQLF